MKTAIEALERRLKAVETLRNDRSEMAKQTLVAFTNHNEAANKYADEMVELRAAIFHLQTKQG